MYGGIGCVQGLASSKTTQGRHQCALGREFFPLGPPGAPIEVFSTLGPLNFLEMGLSSLSYFWVRLRRSACYPVRELPRLCLFSLSRPGPLEVSDIS